MDRIDELGDRYERTPVPDEPSVGLSALSRVEP